MAGLDPKLVLGALVPSALNNWANWST